VNIDSNRSCDVLIVGGGSVGLRAAIEAHDAGAHVLIISKSKKADPHTVVSMQLLGLWIQKITGGKCKYGLSYPFERNWFTRKW
jgi:succinate dehydrogenase/fumarate reductase flavoprotein subunit